MVQVLRAVCSFRPEFSVYNIDDVNHAMPVAPAIAAGQLEAVEQECVGYLVLQRQAAVLRVGKKPARHLHVEMGDDIVQLHQCECR